MGGIFSLSYRKSATPPEVADLRFQVVDVKTRSNDLESELSKLGSIQSPEVDKNT
jgi:hypothetical protein